MAVPRKDRDLFENLFVLELANNHWGQIDRGLKIVRDYGSVVRHNDDEEEASFARRREGHVDKNVT